MAFILFIILMITEIGFVIFELSQDRMKKEWSANRTIADVAQLFIYLVMILLPDRKSVV